MKNKVRTLFVHIYSISYKSNFWWWRIFVWFDYTTPLLHWFSSVFAFNQPQLNNFFTILILMKCELGNCWYIKAQNNMIKTMFLRVGYSAHIIHMHMPTIWDYTFMWQGIVNRMSVEYFFLSLTLNIDKIHLCNIFFFYNFWVIL